MPTHQRSRLRATSAGTITVPHLGCRFCTPWITEVHGQEIWRPQSFCTPRKAKGAPTSRHIMSSTAPRPAAPAAA